MQIPMEYPSQDTFEASRKQGALWRWVLGIVVVLSLFVGLGGVLLKVSYVALVPGAARATEDLVVVEGAEVFPSDGEVFFTTVRVRNDINLWEYLWMRAQPEVDMVPESVIFEGRSVEENRERNAQLMNDSKAVAVAVALEELGYDAVVSDGVLVWELVEGGAAESVIEQFDSIVAIDGEETLGTEDLVVLLAERSPGDEIVLTVEPLMVPAEDGSGEIDSKVVRSGRATGRVGASGVEQYEVSVVLGDREDAPGQAFLGVAPTDRIQFNTDFAFEVDIDSGNVGGPSAGLAFTLAVLDLLTEGELTGGVDVAVTGTIDSNGQVGKVGGVKQKAAAVRDMGADLFLVPAALDPATLEEIYEVAGESLEVVPVASLDEALAVLADRGGQVDALEEFAAANSATQ